VPSMGRILLDERSRPVTVLFDQALGEPNLPNRQADNDGQKQGQAPAHGERAERLELHCGISIRRSSSGFDQGRVRFLSGEGAENLGEFLYGNNATRA